MIQNIKDIDFEEIMFGYSMETIVGPTRLRVFIPDITPDKSSDSMSDVVLFPSWSIFKNATPPPVTGISTESNYITLPLANSFMYWNVKVWKGDKLILAFPNRNPSNGYIIGIGR